MKKNTAFGCLIFFSILLLILFSLPAPGKISQRSASMDCISKLKTDWRFLRNVNPNNIDNTSNSLQPEWTIQDLVHTMRGYFYFSCMASHSNYLVFSTSASVLFDKPSPTPVPILMDSLDCIHGEKYGINILYSDGTVKQLSKKEAEKLVFDCSPVQLQTNDL